jgi:peptidoglycan/xylan/chitin deacetylase (PgdA/CDA1 family)
LLAVAGCGTAPAAGRLTPVAQAASSRSATPVGGQGGGQPAAAPAPADRATPEATGAGSGGSTKRPLPPKSKRAAAAAGAAAAAAEAAAPKDPDAGNGAPGGPGGGPGAPGGPGTSGGGHNGGSGSAGPHSNIRTTTGSDAVALTFDDGPSPYTPQILALLRANGVKATFCLIGVNVRAYPDLVRAIVADGHTLCNHTWSHDLKLGTRSPDRIRADLQRTNDEIHRAAPGAPIKYFRHPGGNFTPQATAIAAELGMASISWNVDPWDWNTKAYPPGPTMINHVVGTVERQTHPGSIVLSHDGGGVRGSTVEAYRTLLPWLRARYTLAKLPT